MPVDKVLVDGIDVTSYRKEWVNEELWREAIPSLTIVFSNSLLSFLPTVGTASSIKVWRTVNTPYDDYVFDGEITQFKPEAGKITCECKGRMIEAIKTSQTRSWDKDIDPEAGVGSEIFKTLVTTANLEYDNSTIISTGTGTDRTITKFIQRDEDNFDRMNLLAEQYDYVIRRDNVTGWVHFEPKGYSVYPYTLTVGQQIQKTINWVENKEQLVNKVIVSGATVYDTLVETFAGPATTFTLKKTPQDTEVRVGGSTGTLKVRGQKGVGVLGTNYDYEIDEEQATLIFASNQSNVYIRYSAQVPCPVILQNSTSIDLYGGPNKTPSVKKISYSDIKNLSDAEARGRAYLDKYSTPFIEAQAIKITDAQTKLQIIKPGDLVNIIDPYTSKDVQVFVRAVRKTYPQPQDEIDIGDKIWRTEDWQAEQMKKINQLFNELNKNQDILTQIFDFTDTNSFEPFYFAAYRESRAGYTPGSQFIFGSATIGILGTNGLGTDTLVSNLEVMIPGNWTFKEYYYSTEFVDTTNTTSTIDTANMQVKQ